MIMSLRAECLERPQRAATGSRIPRISAGAGAKATRFSSAAWARVRPAAQFFARFRAQIHDDMQVGRLVPPL